MRNWIVGIIFILSVSSIYSEIIRIGLFPFVKISQVSFYAESGSFKVLKDDSVEVFTIKKGESISLQHLSGNKVSLKYKGNTIGYYNRLKFERFKGSNVFSFQSKGSNIIKRLYNGDFEVSTKSNGLKLVNEIFLEDYLTGVVKAESGYGKKLEYYKVQATISRTYALSNKYKHKEEGFHLCNRVHCQAYKGRLKDSKVITKAVKESEGIVVVDKDINLITAAFYSNSGGETVNCEDVWNKPLSYLKSKIDTFSRGMPNFTWKKSISKYKWVNYLKRKSKSFISDSLDLDSVFAHSPQKRGVYYGSPEMNILLKDIRKDWKIKSTYFSVQFTDDKVMLFGNGFGHGVGLSQEGAMRMAELNYNFREIIHFYYTDVFLVNLSVLDFYKEL